MKKVTAYESHGRIFETEKEALLNDQKYLELARYDRIQMWVASTLNEYVNALSEGLENPKDPDWDSVTQFQDEHQKSLSLFLSESLFKKEGRDYEAILSSFLLTLDDHEEEDSYGTDRQLFSTYLKGLAEFLSN